VCDDGGVTINRDYSALHSPVSAQQIAAFKEEVRLSGKPWYTQNILQVVFVLIGFAFITLVALAMALPIMASLVSRFAETLNPLNLLGLLGIMLFAGVFVFGMVVAVRASFGGAKWKRWYRLSKFGQANGMEFTPRSPAPSYAGMIFQDGHGRLTYDHLRKVSGRYLDVGNFQYTTGSGKNQSTHRWGFMAFNLDRRLPHMVLDSKANNGLFGSNLPASMATDQVLSLEGNFNDYFTLYCPRQYERDALYVFTPDLMVLLIDNAAPFDVEIIDDWMFVYSKAPFRADDVATYQRLFRIIDTVGAKTLTQTDRYVDDRIGNFQANVVAPQGQRLKRQVPVIVIVILLIFGVGIAAGPLVAILGALFSL